MRLSSSICLLIFSCCTVLDLVTAQYFQLLGSPPPVHAHPPPPPPPAPLRRSAGGCPQVSARTPYECTGQSSNCWSPGVRDTDCPNHGLCCFDGCANVCQNSPPARTTPRPAPSNPCSPSPCGPGTTCSPSPNGNPICRCQAGLIPKPDTITGCGPECVRDPDCASGFVCDNQRCIEEPDPCDPSPCGPYTTCMVNNLGNPICRCEPGLVPKPDTITGCGPECVRDPDCSSGFVCDNQRCIEKPDPCDPTPCGPYTTCTVSNAGNPICRCEPGLVPKPDTITGCGPECVRDPDCNSGYVCDNQRCVEKPDPCDPSPCGPRTTCTVNSYGNPICRCEPGLVPKPDTITGCGPECVRDPDCQSGYICEEQRCIEKPDPCDPSPCGPGTMCMANKFGNPICRCLGKLVPKPDTITGCGPECTRDPDCESGYVCDDQVCVEAPDPCDPNPCGPGAECTPNGAGGFTCSCPPGSFGNARVKCTQGECEVDDDCSNVEACEEYYCVDPCQGDTCRKTDFCRVVNHSPICGFNKVELEPVERDLFVIGQSYENQGPSGRNRDNVVVGGARSGGSSSSSSSSGNNYAIGSRASSRQGSPRQLTVIGRAG